MASATKEGHKPWRASRQPLTNPFSGHPAPRKAKLGKNLAAPSGIAVDDSPFVRQIQPSHGIAVKVGEIAAMPGRLRDRDGTGEFAKPPDQRKS